jgi:hypothetical protein
MITLEVRGHYKSEKKLRFARIPAHRGVGKSTIKRTVELASLLPYTITIAQNGTSKSPLVDSW